MENQFGKISKLNLEADYRDGRTVLRDVSFTAPFKITDKGNSTVQI